MGIWNQKHSVCLLKNSQVSKMMKKTILAVMLCVLLSGCLSTMSQSGGGGSSTGGSSSNDEKYQKGTSGLLLNFMPGAPPAKVLGSSSLSAMVEIQNKGAYHINNGVMYLTGYDKRYLFGSDQKSQSFSIEGKSAYNPNGEFKDIIEFTDDSIENVPSDIDSFSQTLKATACYYYETLATPEICINPNQYSADASDSVCDVRPITLSGGQGAPIEITKVEEELMDNKIVLKIFIKNSGGGTPFVKDKNNCHSSLEISDVDKVNVLEVSFSNYDLTGSCKPKPIRLSKGAGFFICNAELSGLGDSAFMSPLRIKLGYNYRKSTTTSIDIINI